MKESFYRVHSIHWNAQTFKHDYVAYQDVYAYDTDDAIEIFNAQNIDNDLIILGVQCIKSPKYIELYKFDCAYSRI